MIALNKVKNQLLFILSAVFAVILASCLKPDDFPSEPHITLNRIDIDAANQATLYLNFTDGDGNFGLEPGENTDLTDACVKRYNLFLDPYELQSGTWVKVTHDPCLDEDNIPLYYTVPWAKPKGQIQTQKGEIKVELGDGWYESNDYDTLRMEIYIVDRDFNKSNVIVTEQYIKP